MEKHPSELIMIELFKRIFLMLVNDALKARKHASVPEMYKRLLDKKNLIADVCQENNF